MVKKSKIRRNVIHSLCAMKGKNITCIHRFHDGETKNQCELIGTDCHNGLYSQETCGLTKQVNIYQKELGLK